MSGGVGGDVQNLKRNPKLRNQERHYFDAIFKITPEINAKKKKSMVSTPSIRYTQNWSLHLTIQPHLALTLAFLYWLSDPRNSTLQEPPFLQHYLQLKSKSPRGSRILNLSKYVLLLISLLQCLPKNRRGRLERKPNTTTVGSSADGKWDSSEWKAILLLIVQD